MLQRVCEYLHNYFVERDDNGNLRVVEGAYSIRNGAVSLPFVKSGQRIWIVGSSMNDGVYTYRDGLLYDDDDTGIAAGISDEDFKGSVCALAVPPAVTALVSEMRAWEANHGDAIDSPYQSENVIGVYSYTRASGSASSAGCSDPAIWQFRGRLAPWRRTSL